MTPKAIADRNTRLAREATALRENLRKRKQQVRARDVKAPEDEEDDTEPGAL